MISHKIFKIMRGTIATLAVAFAFALALVFASQSAGASVGAMTLSAVNLTMFKSFAAFKLWLAAVPYYYYVFIGLGLLAIAILTTGIAIFKKGRIKRNNVSVLMMVGDSDEEVDATIFKEHFAVVVIAKPNNMLPVSDKVIEPLFPMEDVIKYSSSPSEMPVLVSKNVIVGDEGLDVDLNEKYVRAEEIASTPSTIDETVFDMAEVVSENDDDVLLINQDEEEVFEQDVDGFVAEVITEDVVPIKPAPKAIVKQPLQQSNEQAPIIVTAAAEETIPEPLHQYDEPIASIIDDDSEPIFVDGGYNVYDDDVAIATFEDDFGSIPLVSDTDFDEEEESHYVSEPVAYEDSLSAEHDINVMPIIIASNSSDNAEDNILDSVVAEELPAEIDVPEVAVIAPIVAEVIQPAEFECIEIDDESPKVIVPMYCVDSVFDYEVFEDNRAIIGEQDNEVLFDMDDSNNNVAEGLFADDDNEVEKFEQIEPELIVEEVAEEVEETVEEIIEQSSNVSGMAMNDAILMIVPPNKKNVNTDDQAYSLIHEKDATAEAINDVSNGVVIVDADGDGIVDEVLVDKDILKMRYKTVDMDTRLRRANEDTKAFYSELKNCLLSYSGVKSRVSKKFDTFTVGRFIIAKVAIRGNIINLYLALAGERVDEKYFAENVGDSETYGKTPTLHKVKSRRGCKYGLDLIIELVKELNLMLDSDYQHVNFAAQYPPENIDEKKAEIAHLFRSSASIDELDDLSDEDALGFIDIVKSKEYTINKFNPINKYVVFLDDIASLYESGDAVTIADLIEKVAIPDEPNIYLEVRARGVLDKKLIIEAHSFDLQSVKMIILTDGYVVQYK